MGEGDEDIKLRTATPSCLRLATKKGFKSIHCLLQALVYFTFQRPVCKDIDI